MADISSNQLKIIHSILLSYLPQCTTVWVFGSRVEKAPKKYSDLDLIIDCNSSPISDLILINLREAFDESDLPYKVDLVDWNTLSQSFKNQIQNKELLLEILS